MRRCTGFWPSADVGQRAALDDRSARTRGRRARRSTASATTSSAGAAGGRSKRSGSHRGQGAMGAVGSGGGRNRQVAKFSPMTGIAFGPQFRRHAQAPRFAAGARRTVQNEMRSRRLPLLRRHGVRGPAQGGGRRVRACVVVPAADDRLALAAQAAGVPVHVLATTKIVPGEAIPDGTDLIVAAHTHARVSNEALARSRLGGIGYHPSLLPRHRGIAAVEWTILEGDAIAGGSVYHLADGWDAGADRRAGLVLRRPRRIGARAVGAGARADGPRRCSRRVVPPCARSRRAAGAHRRIARFATRAPMIRRPVVVADEAAPSPTAPLIVTIIGPDRPGIVRLLSDRAQRLRRAAGRPARCRGWPRSSPAWCTSRCRRRTSTRSPSAARPRIVGPAGGDRQEPARHSLPSGLRGVSIELSGDDRIGIVSKLTHILAAARRQHRAHPDRDRRARRRRRDAPSGSRRTCSCRTRSATDELQQSLGALAQEMLVDIAIDDQRSSSRPPPERGARA